MNYILNVTSPSATPIVCDSNHVFNHDVKNFTLPPLPDESSYISRVKEEEYKETAPPKNGITLKWDFQDTKTYAYNCKKQLSYEYLSSRNFKYSSPHKSEISSLITIRSNGDRTADWIVKNLSKNKDNAPVNLNPDSLFDETYSTMTDVMVYQNIGERGISEFDQFGNPKGLNILPPLPGNSLNKGRSTTMPINIAYNFNGSRLNLSGDITIKLIKYVEIKETPAALIGYHFLIEELKVPEEFIGQHQARVHGKGLYYFNLEDNCFESGKMAMVLSCRAEIPASEIYTTNYSGDREEEIFKISLDIDLYVRLQRDRKQEGN